MAVTKLCDATMGNGSSELCDGIHCMADPWYGGGCPWQSLNCLIHQWAMVHLDWTMG
jgi:hypothetical protein